MMTPEYINEEEIDPLLDNTNRLENEVEDETYLSVSTCYQLPVAQLIPIIDEPILQVLFPCHLCDNQFSSDSYLSQHLATHSAKPESLVFTCYHCSMEFTRKSSLIIHVKKHQIQPFTCHLCHKQFINKLSLTGHIKKHLVTDLVSKKRRGKEKQQLFLCNVCNATFTSRYYLALHKMFHDLKANNAKQVKTTNVQQKTDKEKPFVCSICHSNFEKMPFLVQHLKRNHPDVVQNVKSNQKLNKIAKKCFKPEPEAFHCEICQLKCKTRRDLIVHSVNHRNNEPQRKQITISSDPSNQSITFTCKLCSSKFANKDALLAHCQMHIKNEKTPRCELCNCTFDDEASLKVHSEMHIKDKKYNFANGLCDVCGKQIIGGVAKFNAHQKTHTNDNLTCVFCRHRFPSEHQLESHMAFSECQGKTKYICHICHKPSVSQYKLKRHLLIHEGVRPFGCNFCGHRFSQKSDLRKHLKWIHYKEKKPFACELCDKSFVRQHLLEKHVITHADPGLFSCPYCQKGFKKEFYLKVHVDLDHATEKIKPGEIYILQPL